MRYSRALAFIMSLCLLPLSLMAGPERGEAMKEFRENQRAKRQAHFEKQHEENKTFHESLKNMSPEEREAAVKAHREQQMSENKEFHEMMKAESRAKLEEKLAANPNLTEEQKNEIRAKFEAKQKEREEAFKTHREQRKEERKKQ